VTSERGTTVPTVHLCLIGGVV